MFTHTDNIRYAHRPTTTCTHTQTDTKHTRAHALGHTHMHAHTYGHGTFNFKAREREREQQMLIRNTKYLSVLPMLFRVINHSSPSSVDIIWAKLTTLEFMKLIVPTRNTRFLPNLTLD